MVRHKIKKKRAYYAYKEKERKMAAKKFLAKTAQTEAQPKALKK